MSTELLPISSSGDLILVPWIADWHYLEVHPDFNKTFDVALHLGTLVSVIVYFWAEVTLYVGAWFRTVRRRKIETLDERVSWWIFAATIPAAIAGALGESTIENHLGSRTRSPFSWPSSACSSGLPIARRSSGRSTSSACGRRSGSAPRRSWR